MSNGSWRQARYDRLADGSTIARYIDITDQMQQQDALRASEERYALVIAGTNDGIWERNIVTGEIYRTPRIYQILGYDSGELDFDFESFENLIHPEDLDRFKGAIR